MNATTETDKSKWLSLAGAWTELADGVRHRVPSKFVQPVLQSTTEQLARR